MPPRIRPPSYVLSLIALVRFGVLVWYDDFALGVGDSLSRSIDKGLSESEFGLVVLSPDFLRKDWTEYELRGLVAKEIGNRKVILPIWHNLTREQLLAYSPPLADKIALKSNGASIVQTACRIISVVRPDLFEKIQRRAAFFAAERKAPTIMYAVAKLKFGPLLHESLPLNVISRIRLIRAALFGVYPRSMQFWLDGFKRDSHPSREIRIWEHVAACFLEYCYMNQLNKEQTHAVYAVVVGMSVGMPETELQVKAIGLPPDALEKLLLLWSHREPAFDITGPSFPESYSITSDEQERLHKIDIETFPHDVPDDLILDLIQPDEDTKT